MQEKVFVETNVLLKTDKFKFEDYLDVHLSIISIEEIDGLKKSEQVGHQARQATRNIMNAKNKHIKYTYSYSGVIGKFLEHKADNHILAMAYEVWTKDNEVIFLTDDYNLILKAESIGLPCRLFEYEKDEVYKGYKTLSGGTYFSNELFENIDKGINEYGFVTNEYLMLYNSDLDDVLEYRFDGKKLVELKLPSSKVIKGKNSQQRFALDLLNNKDIPIKIIAGGFGSGKTLLSVKSGLNQVIDKEIYKTLMFIRNPVVTDGAEIGFLPGDKSEKIYDFCRPFLQYVEDPKNPFHAENLIKEEKIKMDVTSFLKGISIDDAFVIMDEAEDLNTKLIKLVGSRIGDKSTIVFTGDWNQAESKFKQDNGLLKLIKEGKGNELVGIVILEEDLRSKASKVFAELR
jgi:PhoH-like ATPase